MKCQADNNGEAQHETKVHTGLEIGACIILFMYAPQLRGE